MGISRRIQELAGGMGVSWRKWELVGKWGLMGLAGGNGS